jgi:hypothetical protein
MAAKEKALFAIMLLSSAAFASQSPLEKFLNASFEPGQDVQVQPLLASGSFVLVKADGVETYAVDAQAGKAVEGKQQLQALLQEDAASRTSYAAMLSSALSLQADVESAKADQEAKCMQYTGTDMHECTDKESCTISCLSVPLCSTPLYSDGFWEAILDWTTSRKAFGAALLAYAEGIDSIQSDASAIDSKLKIANQLEALALNMTKNPLFLNRTDEGCSGSGPARCFEFCPKVNYSLERIRREKQNLAALKSAVAEISAQPARADAILEAGARQDSYLASRGRRFEEMRLKMQSDIKKLKGRADGLSARVNDSAIQPLLSSLENLSASIVEMGGSGRYRQAFASEAPYNQTLEQLSSRIDSDEAAYSSVSKALADLRAQLGNSTWLLGNSSAEGYAAILASFSANLTSPQTPAQLAQAKEGLSNLRSQLSEEVAAKAAQQPRQAPSANLPCMPALILIASLALAACRRR